MTQQTDFKEPWSLDTIAEDAILAFWDVVGKHFPDATTGDLSIERTIALTITAEAAIREWVQNNVPTLPKENGMPTATGNDNDLEEMLSHLDNAHVVLEEFGCFVALSQDRATLFLCPMNADGTADRDIDNPRHMNWGEVTAPDPDFIDKVNTVFGTSFDWINFAGR